MTTSAPANLSSPGLVLLTASTPNGIKVSALLEELKLIGAIPGYEFVPISFGKNDQKSEWFESVNPNGRIPALLDNREGKQPINVWESASILLYLTRVYDKDFVFHFKDEDLQQELLNWLFFISGGVGPMQGQANHFFRYAPEKIPYGIKRYQDETKRLYGVYEKHLADGDRQYLVGGKYTIADMCTQPWVRASGWAGVSLAEFPHLSAWVDRIEARPGFQAGLSIPELDSISKMRKDPSLADQHAKAAQDWIMKGNDSKEK